MPSFSLCSYLKKTPQPTWFFLGLVLKRCYFFLEQIDHRHSPHRFELMYLSFLVEKQHLWIILTNIQ